MNDRVMLYFIHMLESIYRIEDYTKDGKDAFLKSKLIQDAVYRNLEIIGEAATRIDDGSRKSFPEIPWKKIVGLRNVLFIDMKVLSQRLLGWLYLKKFRN
jgi:uncharacterized protein with HEPN domain